MLKSKFGRGNLMKKNLSYRDKLLELVRIYKITEVQNYIKRKKSYNSPN